MIDQNQQDQLRQQEAEVALQRITGTARHIHQTFRAKLIAGGMSEAEIDAPIDEEEEIGMNKFIELKEWNAPRSIFFNIDKIVVVANQSVYANGDKFDVSESEAEIMAKIREAEGENIPAQLAECKGVDVVAELIEALKINKDGIRDAIREAVK